MVARSSRIAAMVVVALALTLFAAPPGHAAPETRPASNAPAKAIDLNQAGEEELTAIPGIGKEMARRIVEFRTANGPYRRVEDLLKVKGIGEKSLEKLRPFVKVAKSD